MSQISVADVIQEVAMDENAKKVFLAMPREEQLLAILGMIAYLRSTLATIQKETIEYREKRENREKALVDILDTDPAIKALSGDEKKNTFQKILTLATRPAKPGYLLDKILSMTFILLLLYLLFTGKLPL